MKVNLEKEKNENKISNTNVEKTYFLEKIPQKEKINDDSETKTKEKKEVFYNIEKNPNQNDFKQTTNEEKIYILDKDPSKIKKEEEPKLITTTKEEKIYIVDKDPSKIKEDEPQLVTTTKEETTYIVDKDLTKKTDNNIENEVINTEKPEDQTEKQKENENENQTENQNENQTENQNENQKETNPEKQTDQIETDQKKKGERNLKLPKIELKNMSKSEKSIFKVNMDKETTKDNIQIIEAHDDLEYKYGIEKYPKFDPNNINWVKPIYDWEPKPSTFKMPSYEALELDDINAKIDTGLSLIQNRKNFLKSISLQSKDNSKPKEIDFICIQCLRFPMRAKICKKCGYVICMLCSYTQKDPHSCEECGGRLHQINEEEFRKKIEENNIDVEQPLKIKIDEIKDDKKFVRKTKRSSTLRGINNNNISNNLNQKNEGENNTKNKRKMFKKSGTMGASALRRFMNKNKLDEEEDKKEDKKEEKKEEKIEEKIEEKKEEIKKEEIKKEETKEETKKEEKKEETKEETKKEEKKRRKKRRNKKRRRIKNRRNKKRRRIKNRREKKRNAN